MSAEQGKQPVHSVKGCAALPRSANFRTVLRFAAASGTDAGGQLPPRRSVGDVQSLKSVLCRRYKEPSLL